ncbi:MAG: hypothetical protein IJ057_06325 [Bacteroidales bacterium]|nr:hypothetical protein [Bacteroidales bacterium]
MKHFLFIMILVLVCLLSGCRANLESKTSQSRQYADEIGVVLRRVDSLSSTISERHNVKIEFYPPQDYTPHGLGKPETGSPLSTAPSTTFLPIDSNRTSPARNDIGRMGAVKSIDIEAERTQSEQSLSQADSTAVCKTESESAQKTEKSSEARQDNGTVIGVAIVFAVGLIVYLLLKEFLKP